MIKLTNIEIENFKCFQNTQLEFGDITLLTGANSSGKSSILHSILISLQSSLFPFELSFNGNKVNLGDFENTVHKHLKNKPIKLVFSFEHDNSTTLVSSIWNQEPVRKIPSLLELKVSSDYYDLEVKRLGKYHIKIDYDSEKDINETKLNPDIQAAIKQLTSLIINEAEQNWQLETPDSQIEVDVDNIEELFKSLPNFYHWRILNQVISKFKSFNESSNFISSFRVQPERTYYDKSASNIKIRRDGSNFIEQIVQWESNKSREFTALIDIMKSLNLIDDLKIVRFSGGRFELNVKTSKNSVNSSLNDVGFGISQLLPIIVADLQLGEGSTLVVAQPEIHLHPSVQALFADYIVNQSLKDNKRYILETHSEYIIHRLRLRISKNDISESHVKTYYFQKHMDNSKTYEIKLKKNGSILDAPKEFFETYMLDVMNIALYSDDD